MMKLILKNKKKNKSEGRLIANDLSRSISNTHVKVHTDNEISMESNNLRLVHLITERLPVSYYSDFTLSSSSGK